MDRRSFIGGVLAAISAPSPSFASNSITGGGFVGGKGDGNIIVGDESTARDANLASCTVMGRGAASRTNAVSCSIIGDGAGIDGDFYLCELRGQYAAHSARLQDVVADGYSTLEFADVSRGNFSGVYSGHSCSGHNMTGSGFSALAGSIAKHVVARGDNAGAYAEGEYLTMIGDGVTTARVPGPEIAVSAILTGEPDTPWICSNHGLGGKGQRVNLFIYGDVMPNTPHGAFIHGEVRPFTVLDENLIQYTGNKYKAITPGENLRVAINTNRPKRSIAIGAASQISADDQIVINGKDVTHLMTMNEALKSLR